MPFYVGSSPTKPEEARREPKRVGRRSSPRRLAAGAAESTAAESPQRAEDAALRRGCPDGSREVRGLYWNLNIKTPGECESELAAGRQNMSKAIPLKDIKSRAA